MNTWRILGTTDEWEQCDCCGKPNLKVYVVMEPAEGGEVLHLGTTCAAVMQGRPSIDIRREAREADAAIRAAKRVEDAKRARVEDAAWQAFLDERAPGLPDRILQIDALGGYGAARAAYRGTLVTATS